MGQSGERSTPIILIRLTLKCSTSIAEVKPGDFCNRNFEYPYGLYTLLSLVCITGLSLVGNLHRGEEEVHFFSEFSHFGFEVKGLD